MNAPLRPTETAYDSSLRFIERAGQVCLTVWIATLVILGVFWEKPYADVWQLVLGQMEGGRSDSVRAGMDAGFPRLFLFLQCSMQDIILLLLLYPFFVAIYRKVVEMSFLGKTFIDIRATAERHKDKVRPWGVVGLIAVVVFPFWSAGALTGGVVGYLIGLPLWLTLFTVIAGNLIAVGLWILLFEQMRDVSARVAEAAPTGIVIVLALILVVMLFRRWMKKRHDARLFSPPAACAADAPQPAVPEPSASAGPEVRVHLDEDIDRQP